ncbi:MAG: thiaminase II [Chloroflexi bacterium]|nr:thiaminase II [Chloroflexota bacterium]
MSFTSDIYNRSLPLQKAILEHPFVRGIGNGTLDVERFKHFIRQDYLYLIDYCRVFAVTVARSPDLETMTRFSQMLHDTLHTEMALHRGYCTRFGISQADLEATAPAPTTQAYTNFLLRTAYGGSFGELAAALLPCLWGYSDVGLHLASRGKPPHAPLYGEWIDMYAAPEFKALAAWLRGLVDRLAESAGPEERSRMEQAYVACSRYEYAFWEMAWSQEQWEV